MRKATSNTPMIAPAQSFGLEAVYINEAVLDGMIDSFITSMITP
jgi:hypothetical protein